VRGHDADDRRAAGWPRLHRRVARPLPGRRGGVAAARDRVPDRRPDPAHPMIAVVVGLLALLVAPAAQDLSISVTGGAAQVHAGDRLHYAVTIRDAAGRTHEGVRVELTLPVGARATKVDGGKAPEPW